jgi:hypothetical protein
MCKFVGAYPPDPVLLEALESKRIAIQGEPERLIAPPDIVQMFRKMRRRSKKKSKKSGKNKVIPVGKDGIDVSPTATKRQTQRSTQRGTGRNNLDIESQEKAQADFPDGDDSRSPTLTQQLTGQFSLMKSRSTRWFANQYNALTGPTEDGVDDRETSQVSVTAARKPVIPTLALRGANDIEMGNRGRGTENDEDEDSDADDFSDFSGDDAGEKVKKRKKKIFRKAAKRLMLAAKVVRTGVTDRAAKVGRNIAKMNANPNVLDYDRDTIYEVVKHPNPPKYRRKKREETKEPYT